MNDMLEEIVPDIKLLFAWNKAQIIIALMTRCVQLPHLEGQTTLLNGIIQFISEKLNITDKEVIAQLPLHLCQFDKVLTEESIESYNKIAIGCTILSELFAFQKNQQLIRNFIKLESSVLVELTKISCGSKLVDGFFKNEKISVRNKADLFQKFRGRFNELAENSVAYFCILPAFKILNMQEKEKLCKELLEGINNWTAYKHAPALIKGLSLDLYRLDPNNWTTVVGRRQRKAELFSSIVERKNSEIQTSKKNKTQRLLRMRTSNEGNSK